MLAKRLFAGLPRGPKPVSDSPPQSNDLHGDSRAIRGDVNRPAREENLHVSNEGFETTKTDKGKAKASSTVKGASKPQGVTKKKPAAKAKEQTAAQLKTAAAKTREPAKPTATKKASTTPSQVATSPAQASYANNMQGQGIKRMLDFFPDEEDEDYSPAAKKAKTGAGASVYGERNMATPKKSNKKTKDLEEWDGTPRGFGEY